MGILSSIPVFGKPLISIANSLLQGKASVLYHLYKVWKPKYLNVGGGAYFVGFRWLNLEGIKSIANPYPFQFNPSCKFPVKDKSIQTVYSSHALEHLSPDTVNRVLQESFRVLEPGGRLIIKLPDFEKILKSWNARDESFFGEDWGFNSVTPTWKSRNIPDTLEYRAAMVFCGFWNDEFGHHFSKVYSGSGLNSEAPPAEGAYHGPPVTTIEKLNQIRAYSSPKLVANELRKIVIETEPNYHFNHQSAWSRDELSKLVESHGFNVKTTNSDQVLKFCADVKDVYNSLNISMYLLAFKPS